MPAILAIKMVLARGMDVLAARAFPEDDGILADLRWKKNMPLTVDLRHIRLLFSDAEIFKFVESDIVCLVRGVNRIFNLAGAPRPFTVRNDVEGKLGFLI